MRRAPLYGFVGLVYLLLFAPIALVIANAVNADPDLTEWGGFTTRWLREAVQRDIVIEGLRNSLLIAAACTVISGLVGTLAAVSLRTAGRAVRALTDLTTYSRLIMPELVAAIGLLLTFRALGYPLSMATVIVGHAAFYTAYVIVIVRARLSRRDPFVEDAARDLGATPLRTLLRVTLPEAAPAIGTACLLVFAFSMDNVIMSLFLSSGLNTLPLVLLTLIHTRVTPLVNAIAALLVAVSTAAIAAFLVACLLRGRLHGRRRTATEADR
jgi:spermidine/putrescine transport system permease protein